MDLKLADPGNDRSRADSLRSGRSIGPRRRSWSGRDEQRTVVKRNYYAPFGETYAPTVIDGTGYTGHVMDQATGLTYMQARYYDPQIGRFLSADPMPADPNSGANFNSYWYANNNPYRFADPDGRFANVAGGCGSGVGGCSQGSYGGDSGGGGPSSASGARVHNWENGQIPKPSTQFQLGTKAESSQGSGRIDLRDQEGVEGSHTIAQHIGKSDEYLARRMDTPFEVGNTSFYRGSMTTFSSLESANSLVSSVLGRSEGAISAYLASGSNVPFPLTHQFYSPTGRGAFRPRALEFGGRPSAKITYGPTYGVKVMIVPSASTSRGYRVLTAYPTR